MDAAVIQLLRSAVQWFFNVNSLKGHMCGFFTGPASAVVHTAHTGRCVGGGVSVRCPPPHSAGFGLLCCCLPAHLCFPAFVVSLCLKQSSGQEHRPGTTCSGAQTLRDSHPAFSETLCCMSPLSLSCHGPLILQFSDFQLGREMTVSLRGRNLPFLLESSISLELDLRWG